MKKLEYIDGIKGVGAGIVYLCHFVYAFYYAAYSLNEESAHTVSGVELAIGKTPLNLLYSGNSAVCIFLVFSGFLLCLSYFQGGERKKLKKSAWKRYFRLMPMILISNLLVYSLMCLGLYRNAEVALITKSEAWFAGFNQFVPSFSRMIYESLFWCFVNGSNAYNGVLWTIPYLFWGALLVYLAAYWVGENPLRYVTYVAMLLAAARTDVYFAAVFLGFAICDVYCTQEKWMQLWKRTALLPIAAFVLGVYLLSYPSMGVQLPGTLYGILPSAYTTIYHIAGAALVLCGVLGASGLQRLFSLRVFREMGNISYSLYLLHFPVIATFSCWFFLHFYGKMSYHLTAAVDFLCTTVLVLVISALSRRYLEPVSGWLIGCIEGRRAKKES